MKNALDLSNFSTKHAPRAYVNSLVRFHHPFGVKDRLLATEKAGWNVFQFPSEMLTGGDLLSDSGTTTLNVRAVGGNDFRRRSVRNKLGLPKTH